MLLWFATTSSKESDREARHLRFDTPFGMPNAALLLCPNLEGRNSKSSSCAPKRPFALIMPVSPSFRLGPPDLESVTILNDLVRGLLGTTVSHALYRFGARALFPFIVGSSSLLGSYYDLSFLRCRPTLRPAQTHRRAPCFPPLAGHYLADPTRPVFDF